MKKEREVYKDTTQAALLKEGGKQGAVASAVLSTMMEGVGPPRIPLTQWKEFVAMAIECRKPGQYTVDRDGTVCWWSLTADVVAIDAQPWEEGWQNSNPPYEAAEIGCLSPFDGCEWIAYHIVAPDGCAWKTFPEPEWDVRDQIDAAYHQESLEKQWSKDHE